MEFEWDRRKAATNLRKHGVRFENAEYVFDDPFAIDQLDLRQDYGEERYFIIGEVDNRLLYVAYTMRNPVIGIISARGAEPFEERCYHAEAG